MCSCFSFRYCVVRVRVCEGCVQVFIFGSFELVFSLEVSAFVMYRKPQHHVSSQSFSLLF